MWLGMVNRKETVAVLASLVCFGFIFMVPTLAVDVTNDLEVHNPKELVQNLNGILDVHVFCAVPMLNGRADILLRATVRETWGGHPLFNDSTFELRFFVDQPAPGNFSDVVYINLPEMHALRVKSRMADPKPHQIFVNSSVWRDMQIKMMEWGLEHMPRLTHYIRMDADAYFCPAHLLHILSDPKHQINAGLETRAGLMVTGRYDESFLLFSASIVRSFVSAYERISANHSDKLGDTLAPSLKALFHYTGLSTQDHPLQWWQDASDQDGPGPVTILHSFIKLALETKSVKRLLSLSKTHEINDICDKVVYLHKIKDVREIKLLHLLSPSLGTNHNDSKYTSGDWKLHKLPNCSDC